MIKRRWEFPGAFLFLRKKWGISSEEMGITSEEMGVSSEEKKEKNQKK